MGRGGRRGSCTFSGRTLGFPRTRFSLPLFFRPILLSPAPALPPPLFASLALSEFLPRSLLVRQETGREGGGGEGEGEGEDDAR